MPTMISKYFSLEELTHTSRNINNTPNATEKANLVRLAKNLLDPLREAWGRDVTISSGYRSPALNAAIGGSESSAHMSGFAADMTSAHCSTEDLIRFTAYWLRNYNIPFDQFIDEANGSKKWLHLAICNGSGKQRREFLKYRNGKYSNYDW